eukprot:CAMPEP_0185799246 /NCGR_PEP_ID=MMETSP1322-20130828/205_1 /TAXON_ID=265543 /ORGANISM="Minutocellus polymorphus, Strain RCC2270" /LENGTH=50 /DNA_ID=CAMNT_0028494801 /DNA_START=685 /DNA_END=837 /DNA_ORIENTATION=+
MAGFQSIFDASDGSDFQSFFYTTTWPWLWEEQQKSPPTYLWAWTDRRLAP